VSARGLTRGELVSAASALTLLVLMVSVAWYGVDGIPGRTGSPGNTSSSETGWEGLTGLRWLALLAVLVALAVLALHLARPPRQTLAALRLALLALSSATFLGLTVRVLIDLPSADRVVDQKLGAVLGMLASLVMTLGAAQAVREQRARLAASP
jgi:hypothetical protein